MEFIETASEIMAAVGGYDDAIELVIRRGDATWGVLVGEIGIEIELDPEDGTLTLYAEIGTPPDDRRLAVCELLLCYSLQTRQTGGVRAAMDEPGGRLILLADFGIGAVDASGLAAVLSDFAAKAALWRGWVTAEDEPPVPDMSSFIRV